jgi:hypothetical protein
MLLLVFVTSSDEVVNTVSERRLALVPSDLRANGFAALGGENVVLSTFKVGAGSTTESLLTHLCQHRLKHASSALVLTDESMPDLVAQLGDIFCVSRFDAPGHGQNVSNLLAALLARVLRTFRHYRTRFDDRKYQQVLRLPIRNFVGPDMLHLQSACRDMMNRQNFARELDKTLQRFRSNRQRPKKASNSPVTYLIDDDGKHFTLGHEKHAMADTAIPPHSPLCELANAFRFGRAFDGTKHFNVSKDRNAPLNGLYPDCHDYHRSAQGAQHLNMFSNDFF